MNPRRPSEDTIPLHVAVTSTATSVWVEVSGEVDLSNRQRLESALSEVDFARADVVHLDLRHLTFCDTSGCHLLLQLEREARLSGHETRILGARPTVRKVLTLLAADDGPTFV